jgi:antitoxin YefM
MVILLTMSETRTLVETKAHLSDLVARVNAHHERVTVTVHGQPRAVLIAPDDLESLEETIAILADSAGLGSILASEAELSDGLGESESQLVQAMTTRRTDR